MDALFELGLFMGHLGRERTFVVHPSGESVKIPSDWPASRRPRISGLAAMATTKRLPGRHATASAR